jgi:hypothetical protein
MIINVQNELEYLQLESILQSHGFHWRYWKTNYKSPYDEYKKFIEVDLDSETMSPLTFESELENLDMNNVIHFDDTIINKLNLVMI